MVPIFFNNAQRHVGFLYIKLGSGHHSIPQKWDLFTFAYTFIEILVITQVRTYFPKAETHLFHLSNHSVKIVFVRQSSFWKKELQCANAVLSVLNYLPRKLHLSTGNRQKSNGAIFEL